jgi:heme-degrading monooxygenase HmoA
MSTISEGQQIITLINIFTVEPKDQQALIDILTEATEQVISTLTGFISANIHTSLDGKKVVNYAQWKTKADFEAIFENPEAKQHMKEASKFAVIEPSLYKVVHVSEK